LSWEEIVNLGRKFFAILISREPTKSSGLRANYDKASAASHISFPRRMVGESLERRQTRRSWLFSSSTIRDAGCPDFTEAGVFLRGANGYFAPRCRTGRAVTRGR